jgi:hypothetical protein
MPRTSQKSPLAPFDFRKDVSYDPAAKRRFHSEARKRLLELAAALGLAPDEYDLRRNDGGIAVMWNAR